MHVESIVQKYTFSRAVLMKDGDASCIHSYHVVTLTTPSRDILPRRIQDVASRAIRLSGSPEGLHPGRLRIDHHYSPPPLSSLMYSLSAYVINPSSSVSISSITASRRTLLLCLVGEEFPIVNLVPSS
jgi:hypothetical protein